MAATDPPRWPLYTHALLTGFGWIPVAIVVSVNPDLQDRILSLPSGLLGPLLLGSAVFLFPPIWPLLIAGAVSELTLAERFDRTASRQQAARMFRRYTFGFGFIAIAGFIAAVAAFGQWGSAVTTAWMGPAAVAAIHHGLARWAKP